VEKRLNWDVWGKLTRDDMTSLEDFVQGSFDTVVGKALIPDMAYDGFLVNETGVGEVLVANGHLFANGKVYVNDNEGGTTISLLQYLPSATKKIVAITVWGSEIDTKTAPRTFLTDPETKATSAREVATQHWRWGNISVVATAAEGPDPARPAIAAGVCPVAWVTLGERAAPSVNCDSGEKAQAHEDA
jgi:hypothetical protein